MRPAACLCFFDTASVRVFQTTMLRSGCAVDTANAPLGANARACTCVWTQQSVSQPGLGDQAACN